MIWKPAVPVTYLNLNEKVGRVYLGTSKGPPLQVKRRTPGDDPDRICVVVEFENCMAIASKEIAANFGIPELATEEVLRVAMHLSDARKLCHNLITTLAISGDPIASAIQNTMSQAMDELLDRDEGRPDS